MAVADDGVIEWHPARLLQRCPEGSTQDWTPFSLVMLNQPPGRASTLHQVWTYSSYRVAADGGANRLLDIAGTPSAAFDNLDAIVGDLDSLTPEARTYFNSKPTPTKIILDPDQYSTDFGKAVKHVRVQCPGMDIVAVGGLGGRVDQGLSQLHHLYLFQTDPGYAEGRMYFLSSQNLTFLLKKGKHRIWVREVGSTPEVFSKHVGILPMKEPSIISTKGLEWDVTDWETEFGGQISTSNHVLPETETVEVETNKDIVFTIALSR